MDKVLLVSVIALAVALLSMLVNLALVWKISDLKNRLEYVDLTVSDRTGTLHLDDVEISNQLNKLECNTKDAFEKLTNHLTRHDDQIDRVAKKYEEMETRVARHTGQLEDLGNFAGITTGELRVLEQKIYNSCKPKELPEPEPITKQIEESIALCHQHTDINNIELNRLGERLSVVEIKLDRAIDESVKDVNGIRKIVNLLQEDILLRYNELNFKIKGVCPKELNHEEDIRKHKPDRKRKDNYYRRPNQVSVEKRDDFSGDVFK